MKKLILLIPLIFLLNGIKAQDIISSAFVTTGFVDLGDQAMINFNVNELTFCDSYTVNVDVNYLSKTINVEVDYLYNSFCDESFSVFTEFTQVQLVLTGTYFVNLKLNVPSDIFLSETLLLGAITVGEPNNSSCSNSFIPFLEGFCPFASNTYCACDGVSYDNECLAYLQAGNGLITFGSCSQYVASQSNSYSCNTYNSNWGINFFEKYQCDNRSFFADELIFTYDHQDQDSLFIEYTSIGDVTLFLMTVSDGNLSCLQKSENNKLVYQDLPLGQYYLIADSAVSSNYSVTFCDTPVSTQEVVTEVRVYPNPASEYLYIMNDSKKVDHVEFINLQGQSIKMLPFDERSGRVNVQGLKGLHIVKINFADGTVEMVQVYIQA